MFGHGELFTVSIHDERFIGPFKVLERVRSMAYRIALPPRLAGIHNVFHISALRRYVFDALHMIDFTLLELGKNLRHEDRPMWIFACETLGHTVREGTLE